MADAGGSAFVVRRDLKTVVWVLGGVALLTASDVAADMHFGSNLRHILVEVAIIVTALGGAVFFWRQSYSELQSELRDSVAYSERWRKDAERWRREAAHFVEGLSQAIDRQFDAWALTPSEKEVALLLLKGLSLKEIADIRAVQEKTVRQQCQAIYRKGDLSGRADLSAYFLEDLLAPVPGATAQHGGAG